MAQERGHIPLARADAIRSRLIDTFSLIEHLQGLTQAVPRHTLREILDPSLQKKLMSGDQHQLVRFSIKPRHMGHITHSQRMLSRLRVRCSQRPPLSLWAGWVTESPIFSKFIISLIFLNTIVLMVEIELMESTNTKLWPLRLTLEVADWFILFSFILEILLMWMSGFTLFWNNAWNVFDFVVTMLSLLPEFVVLMGVSGKSVWLQLLRISRVLRSLKLFARFRQIKVIILALARALKSMTFLLMLLLIFFYIFAVTGVYFFQDYSRSTIENLEYNMFFSDLLNSLVTVFILFTLDHWYAVLQDVWKVPEASRVFSSIYVILWLLLGSIIFRNIIVAMMVTNFQNIRNELSEEMTHLEVQYKADIFKRQIIQRRQNLSPESVRGTRQGKPSEDLLGGSKESVVSDPGKNDANKSEDAEKSDADADDNDADADDNDDDADDNDDDDNADENDDDADDNDDDDNADENDDDADDSDAEQDEAGKGQKEPPKAKVYSSSSSACSSSYSSSLADLDHVDNLDWETLVHENLPGLMDMDQDDRVVWPRDSLFRYFELLEKLQYNIEERKKLQEFAVQALMSFEDK
ncbi:cation channel sperm-associated protein 2 isoform X2 [Arvicola amphibius]|nr:cation channel sperm-associated protein 2 isoform X2 [Arvicola amphibius]XP_038185392.1 cation channel sperm-associated protein 2 isoform X2 [Arvicola amphibius]XP_038185393.1 cation channel sperm-associated protein 2 isoform X2 [Arvicola amphibius]